ncbi:MAG: hypothetical protein JKY92_08040, partial [Magnetovibrio sp.]|nr:hypothetical protein [Magnetovibrio sp.]
MLLKEVIATNVSLVRPCLWGSALVAGLFLSTSAQAGGGGFTATAASATLSAGCASINATADQSSLGSNAIQFASNTNMIAGEIITMTATLVAGVTSIQIIDSIGTTTIDAAAPYSISYTIPSTGLRQISASWNSGAWIAFSCVAASTTSTTTSSSTKSSGSIINSTVGRAQG